MYVLEQAIRRDQMPRETEERSPRVHQGRLGASAMPTSSATRSRKPISNPDNDFGQNLFDRYVAYADAWIEDHDFKDPDTGRSSSIQLQGVEL